MNNNAQIINFFIELIKRLKTKSPKFFRVLSLFFTCAALVTGLPVFLNTYFDIVLPEWANILANKSLGLVSFALAIGFQLPTDTPVVGIDNSGVPLKATDTNTLPFTAKSEATALTKTDL